MGQSLAEDIPGHSGNLDVHLETGNPRPGTGHLEIHVPVVIFIPQDIRENRHFLSLFDQTHGDPGHRAFDLNAGIHEGQRSAAHRSHGGGAVGFQDFRYDADGVGVFFDGWKNAADGPLGQSAVSNIPTAGSPHHAHFAHAVGGKIVVEHEGFESLSGEGIDLLFIIGRSQGDHGRDLGLPPGKPGRTVGPGKPPDLDVNRPDFVEGPSIHPAVFLKDRPADDGFFQGLIISFELSSLLGEFFQQGSQGVLPRLLQLVVARLLIGNGQGLKDLLLSRCADPHPDRLIGQQHAPTQNRVEGEFGDLLFFNVRNFRFPGCSPPLILQGHFLLFQLILDIQDGLQGPVAEEDGIQ